MQEDGILHALPPTECTSPMVDPLLSPPARAVPVAGIPAVYFNGFAIALSSADVAIQISIDNQPLINLKGSYTTMKTLSEGLAMAMARFEKVTEHTVMTQRFVENALKADHADGDKEKQ